MMKPSEFQTTIAVSYTHLDVYKRQAESRRQTIAERRAELEQAKQPQKTASEAPKGAAPVHERPVTTKQPENFRNHADTAHAGKPAIQPAPPSIRERRQVSYEGTVAERASVPVVKAASIHYEHTPPVRAERQLSLIHISPIR